MSMRTMAMVVAVLALLGACGGGGGGSSGFQPLDHTAIPDQPRGPDPIDEPDAGTPSQPALPNIPLLDLDVFERAQLVVGQPDFSSGDVNQGGGPQDDTLNAPQGIAVGDDLWVADYANHRVLRYPLPLSGNEPKANLVLGQNVFTTAASGVSAGDLYYPTDVVISEGRVIVVDSGNNRVVIWSSIPAQNGSTASVVVGQPNMWSNNPATTRSGLRSPQRAFVHDDHLIVADTGNNRIMVWRNVPTVSGAPADYVIGQPDFSSSAAALTQSGLNTPLGIWADDDRLAVCDGNHNRVMIWKPFPEATGAAASQVLGQPDFVSDPRPILGGNTYTKDRLRGPNDVISNGRQLVVCTADSMVVMWPLWPTLNGEEPSIVLGQSDWWHSWPNDDDQNYIIDGPTDRVFYGPTSLEIHGTQLYVSDWNNHRVLRFE